MRYQPVKVVRTTEVEYRKAEPGAAVTGVRAEFPMVLRRKDGVFVLTPRRKSYWQARSRMLGDCGHRHRTEEAAEPCKERMMKQWTALRSRAAKEAYAARHFAVDPMPCH